jgi:hypothetical protein
MKKETLKKTISRLQGKKSFIRREADALRLLLAQSGMEGRFRSLMTRCFAFAILGSAAAFPLNNAAAAPLLSGLAFLIPIWRLKLYAIKYEKHISSGLESALSLVTASFIRSNNVEIAVSENLTYFDPLLRRVFEEFLCEYRLNANLETCIMHMSMKIGHRVFSEWCTALIKAVRNSALREDLASIVSKLSSARIIQENLDTEKSRILFQYVIMLILLVMTIPLIGLVNRDWFLCFFTHPLGKFAVAFGIFALVCGIQSLVRCSRPVRYRK